MQETPSSHVGNSQFPRRKLPVPTQETPCFHIGNSISSAIERESSPKKFGTFNIPSYICSVNLKSKGVMEKEYKRPKNMLRQILDCKQGMRECIQNGGTSEDMKKTAEYYGFKLATPL